MQQIFQAIKSGEFPNRHRLAADMEVTTKTIQRIERYPVPDVALREAILNALVHRDYAVGAPVQIRVYEDRLKIWNPAVLPDGWTVKNFLREHASTPFNPAIANVFFRSGEIETWGRGIQRIFAACKDAGTPRPALTFDGTGLALEFRYAPEYLKAIPAAETPPTGQATPQVEKLLRAAETPVSRGELQHQVGLADRKHFREALLNPLIEAGWL